MITILLVEDETNLAGIIQRELEAVGYQVWHAADGRQALRLFAAHSPDLVILDWILPEMNGLDVLREIRFVSAIPIMMLTARTDPTDRVVGLEVGADDYLLKPFNMPELIARIRALLRREERIRQTLAADQTQKMASIQYGSLVLDPQSLLCTLDDAPLALTALEFELLSLFLANLGRTFNRKYLVESVWKSEYIEGDRSVDNEVLRLRKKLEGLGANLETVRGMGYRFRRKIEQDIIESESKS